MSSKRTSIAATTENTVTFLPSQQALDRERPHRRKHQAHQSRSLRQDTPNASRSI